MPLPPGSVVLTLERFGGLVTALGPTAIGDGQSPDMRNVLIDGERIVKDEVGYAALAPGPEASAVYGLSPFYTDAGQSYIVAHIGTSLYTATTGSFTKRSGATSLGANDSAMFSFLDRLYVANRTGYFRLNADLTFAAATGPAENCNLAALRANRVFLSGGATNPSYVYFSDLADPENWTVGASQGGVIKVETSDSDRVTALWNTSPALLVFKEDEVYALTGSSPDDAADLYNFQPLLRPGAVNAKTVTQGEQWVYWLSREGVHRFAPPNRYQTISDDIASIFDPRSSERINQNAISRAAAAYIGGRYVLDVPLASSTTNNARFVFDARRQTWARLDLGAASRHLAVYRLSSVPTLMRGADAATGKVYQDMVGEDADGAAIDAYWTSKLLSFPRMMKFLYVEVEARPESRQGGPVVDVKVGDQTYWQTAGLVNLYGPNLGIVRAVASLGPRYGRSLQLRLRWNSTYAFAVERIRIHAEAMGAV